MPAPIDKHAERQRILEAFQSCLAVKPFDKITLRDIAVQANTPHPTVLTYFKDKKDIILSYVGFIADRSIRYSKNWVQTHSVHEFPDEKTYVKTLFITAAKLNADTRLLYTGALNVYIMAQYEPSVREKILAEFQSWVQTLQQMLSEELDFPEADPAYAGFLLTCLEGICLNTYNGVFDEETCDGVLDIIADIFASQSRSLRVPV